MENPSFATSYYPSGGSPYSKFYKLNDPDISNFISSIPRHFEGAVRNVMSDETTVASDRILQNRFALANLASTFHSDAKTMTSEVQKEISVLCDPRTKLIAATHQPNLFAYGGVFKKFVLLEAVKRAAKSRNPNCNIATIFFIIDHDFLDETWMRVAQLPSLQSSEGSLELRLPITESQRWKMVSNIPVPSHNIVCKWKSQIMSWLKSNSSVGEERMHLLSNFEEIWSEYEDAYSTARTYADLNAFFMSRIVNLQWNYSVLFVRLSQASRVFRDGFAFLLANYGKYSNALDSAERLCTSRGIDTGVSSFSHMHAPLWLHCQCGSKAAAKVITRGKILALSGACISCHREIRLVLGDPDNFEIDNFAEQLSPKAIPILLLLSRDIGISSYVSGTGGLGYLVDGRYVAKSLGIKVPSVLIWSSKDSYRGIGQRGAAKYTATANEPLTTKIEQLAKTIRELEYELKPLLEERAQQASLGRSLDSILPRIFSIKEEQRRIRREHSILMKAKNALSVSPCILDYGINFGIKQSEQMWNGYLRENGELAESVVMTSTTAASA